MWDNLFWLLQTSWLSVTEKGAHAAVHFPPRLFSAWMTSPVTSPLQKFIFLHYKKIPDTLQPCAHFLKPFPGSQASPSSGLCSNLATMALSGDWELAIQISHFQKQRCWVRHSFFQLLERSNTFSLENKRDVKSLLHEWGLLFTYVIANLSHVAISSACQSAAFRSMLLESRGNFLLLW